MITPPRLFPGDRETIEGIGRSLRAGQTSCVAILDHCFHQIDLWDGRVNAWAFVDRASAMRQARELDEEIDSGTCRGPLHGIPFGVKDIIDVAGMPTSAGFRPWRERVVGKDAAVVARLRQNGAVILGKTVTTQFAWVDPPVTRNPWNLERTPGGSSSGSAAAVATGMCLAAVGTQTGGSIIRPAAFCGVAGFKPGYDESLFAGILPLAHSFDHPGPIARTVEDLRLIAPSFGLFDRPEVETPAGVDRWADAALKPGGDPPRVCRLRGFFDTHASAEAVDALDRALGRSGAVVTERADDLFDFEAIGKAHRLMLAAEAAREHEERLANHPDDFAPRIRALVEEGAAVRAPDYLQAREFLEKLRTRSWACWNGWFDPSVDALVMPAARGAAPDLLTTGDPLLNSPWSFLGWPVITLPVGLSAEGTPLGAQLVGTRASSNASLFKAALWWAGRARLAPTEGSR